jgi:hypothetical protein
MNNNKNKRIDKCITVITESLFESKTHDNNVNSVVDHLNKNKIPYIVDYVKYDEFTNDLSRYSTTMIIVWDHVYTQADLDLMALLTLPYGEDKWCSVKGKTCFHNGDDYISLT